MKKPDPLLSLTEVAQFMRVSRRLAYSLLSEGMLPPPDVWAGERSPRWTPATILKWGGVRSEAYKAAKPNKNKKGQP